MIIECESIEEARKIIGMIKEFFKDKIFNFIINTNYDKIYIIINGQIDLLDDKFLNTIHAKKVFSSLENDLFFVNNKKFINPIRIGKRAYENNDGLVTVIAGPCEVESYQSLYDTAKELSKIGVSIFRAMPEKPRTSPYNFQGVGNIGWEYLARIKKEFNLPILAEVFCQEDIDLAKKYDIDIIQIGARNMQNYNLIKKAAASGITTVLKKGMWCNNEQLLKCAEYFFVYGKGNVILSERGIQTHEKITRNTFDISSIKLLKSKSILPVMADASHGTGVRELVIPVNAAAVLMGADVLEVEVHINPDETIKPGDYYQMLNINQYKELLNELETVMKLNGKNFDFKKGVSC